MRQFLNKISITHTLLGLYIFLAATLLYIRVSESGELKPVNKELDQLVETSSIRKELLSEAQKSMYLARMYSIEMLYQHTEEEIPLLQKKVRVEFSKFASTLSAFEKLITTPVERQLFDSVIVAHKNLKAKREEAFKFFDEKKLAAVNDVDKEIRDSFFPALEQSLYRLSLLTSQTDKQTETALRDRITYTRQLSRIAASLIVILLIVFGIILLLNHVVINKNRARLRESEIRYRTFVEKTHDFVSRIDQNGVITFANNKVKERLGYKDEDLADLKLIDIVDDEYKEYLIELVNAPKTRPEQKIFCVLKSKTGEKVFIEGSLIWKFRNNKFAGATTFLNDVTEKVLLQKSLRDSENKFKQLFDLAPTAMFAFDPDSLLFVQVNASAILLYGYTREEFLKKTIMDIRPYEEVGRTSEAIRKIIKENQIHQQTYTHLKKDGTRMDVEVYGSKIVLNDKPLIMSSITDITEKKLNENRINQAILKTQEDERYEIGGELHDNICQILAAAKMSLGQMKDNLTPEIAQAYQQTMDSIILATDETRNLSHRLAPVFFQKGSLKDAIERLIGTFNILNNYQFSFYFDKAFETHPIDQELQLNLYRIIQEGVRNIIKYAQATEIKLDLVLHKNNLRLLISDNGIGFDPQEITAGIGLANMRRRAEFFSGKMNLYSSPGEGSEIEIIIPMQFPQKTTQKTDQRNEQTNTATDHPLGLS